MGEAHQNQVLRLRNQLFVAARNFRREETLIPVQISEKSNNMDEELKVAHKVVDVLDRTKKNFCVKLLRNNVHKPENSYAQVLFFARKKKNGKFQLFFLTEI